MSTKRLLLTALAVFVFIFAYEWVFHGILLKDTYGMTPSLWRPQTEMMQHFHWLVLGQAVIALMFTVLFAVARTVGWISQWKEMIEDPHQKIGRPRQLYTGAARRDYVPISRRK